MSALSPLQSNLSSPDYSSFFNALGGNPLALGSAFSQAMSQAKPPADAAKVQWLQAEYSNLMDLSSMGSGSSSSSISGLGMGDLFGLGGPLGLPTWAADVERLMGGNSDIQQLI